MYSWTTLSQIHTLLYDSNTVPTFVETRHMEGRRECYVYMEPNSEHKGKPAETLFLLFHVTLTSRIDVRNKNLNSQD